MHIAKHMQIHESYVYIYKNLTLLHNYVYLCIRVIDSLQKVMPSNNFILVSVFFQNHPFLLF